MVAQSDALDRPSRRRRRQEETQATLQQGHGGAVEGGRRYGEPAHQPRPGQGFMLPTPLKCPTSMSLQLISSPVPHREVLQHPFQHVIVEVRDHSLGHHHLGPCRRLSKCGSPKLGCTLLRPFVSVA